MAVDIDLIAHYRTTHGARIYGNTSVKNLRFLRPEIMLLRPASILDYGCGQSVFLDHLKLDYNAELHRYDPAIPGYSELPAKKVELLVSIDVLEHIEEQDIDATLAQMAGICRDAIIVIDTRPAQHILPDGRNAHVTLHPHAWWREKLSEHFSHLEPVRTARRSRAAFRTWPRSSGQTWRFGLLRLKENAIYYARRLVGRHKELSKLSATGHARRD